MSYFSGSNFNPLLAKLEIFAFPLQVTAIQPARKLHLGKKYQPMVRTLQNFAETRHGAEDISH